MTVKSERLPQVTCDYFTSDIEETFIIPLVTNYGYEYLGSIYDNSLVENLPGNVMKILSTLPQDLDFFENHRRVLRELGNQRVSLQEFSRILRNAYDRKASLQYEMRALNIQFQGGLISYEHLVEQGSVLIEEGMHVEPIYFAASALIKEYVDREITMITSIYGGTLSQEELGLLSTPLSTNAFTQRYLDVLRNHFDSSEESDARLEARYGKSIFNSMWYKDITYDPLTLESIELGEKERYRRKGYFLLGRNIPNAVLIDSLLTVDHILDKYVQFNRSFFHDVFLMMQIICSGKKISELTEKEEIDHLIKQAIEALLLAGNSFNRK